jgi:hypothetical protein
MNELASCRMISFFNSPENVAPGFGKLPGQRGQTEQVTASTSRRSSRFFRCEYGLPCPLSPLLANALLDEVDKELQRRGHCFVRYADDANVYVRSHRAGKRVMGLLLRLYGKLRLKVNTTKSAVASVFPRKFLGYSF